MKKIIIIVLAFFITASAKAQLFLKINLSNQEVSVAKKGVDQLADGINKTMLKKIMKTPSDTTVVNGVQVKGYIFELPQLQALYAGVSKTNSVGRESLLDKIRKEIKKQVGQ